MASQDPALLTEELANFVQQQAGGAPSARTDRRSRRPQQAQQRICLATAATAIAVGAEGEIVLQEGETLLDGDTVTAKNNCGVEVGPGKVQAVSGVNGAWSVFPVGSSDTAGLPPGASGCNCSNCVEGSPSEDCEGCGCLNTRRNIYPPGMLKPNGTSWPEASAPRLLRKVPGQCLYRTGTFPLTCTIGEGEEAEEVHDSYRWKTYQIPSSEGVPACWKTELEIVLGEGEEANCDIVTAEFTKDASACDAAGADCLCPWHFKRGIFNNIRAPQQCKLCVTPVAPVSNVCPGCALAMPNEMLFTFSDDGDVVPILAGLKLLMYADWRGEAFDYCSGNNGLSDITMSYASLQPDELFNLDSTPSCSGPFSLEGGWIVSGGDVAVFQLTMVAGGMVIASWQSGDVPACDQEVVFPFTLTLGATSVCFDVPSGLPTTITVTAGPSGPATSSGHVGGNCGAADPCETQKCRQRVVENLAGVKSFVTDETSTCTDECGYCYSSCDSLSDPTHGSASGYEVDDVLEKDCEVEEADWDYVEIGTSPSGAGACACGTGRSARLCLSAPNEYTGTIYDICGNSYTVTLKPNGSGGYHITGGPVTSTSNSNPAGPFFWMSGLPGGCHSLRIDVLG